MHDAVVRGGGLQLEIEGAAEALAQRQAPGAVDARAEGRVEDELHAAGFVEEALGHHVRGCGHARPERARRLRT